MTTPSTRKLSEVAKQLVIPSGIKTTLFPRIRRRLSAMGIEFDGWQNGLGAVALGCREDGKFAATVGGVCASVPRQVGKTFSIGSILIALAIEFPNMKIIWTSHHNRTTTATFQSMQGMVRKKRVWPFVEAIRTANGEQEIKFINGSIIMFGAREQGFGRGMDAIDVLVFDEAQILSIKALEDMVPSTNQARNPHGGLVFFIGTPPRPSDPGEAFTAKRTRALSGTSSDVAWIEIGASDDDRSDDPAAWARMNPSFPHRTPLESIQRMRENIPDDASWRREAMGIWDKLSASGVFAAGAWAAAKTTLDPGAPEVLGIGADIEGTRLSLGSYGAGHVAPVNRMHFTRDRSRFVQEVARISIERGIPVAIDGRGPAAPIIPDLKAMRVDLYETSLNDLVQASADMREAVESGAVRHGDYPELNEAVDAATWRTIGDRKAFGRKKGDISMLEAVSLARHVALLHSYDPLDSVA